MNMLLSAQKNMYDELREHRSLFSEIKESISEQKQTYSSVVTSVNNLADSIDRHEHIVEKVLAIENWRINARLEERITTLEKWHVDESISQANWKGRFAALAAVATVATSIGVYVLDIIIRKYISALGGTP
jgi:hypothetical protein